MTSQGTVKAGRAQRKEAKQEYSARRHMRLLLLHHPYMKEMKNFLLRIKVVQGPSIQESPEHFSSNPYKQA
jgi:predicted HD phosphohydrolase